MSKEIPDLLDCDNFRDFWISWDSSLRIGRGHIVDVDTLMTVDNVNIDFTSVSVGTHYNITGLWRFPVGMQEQPCELMQYIRGSSLTLSLIIELECCIFLGNHGRSRGHIGDMFPFGLLYSSFKSKMVTKVFNFDLSLGHYINTYRMYN